MANTKARVSIVVALIAVWLVIGGFGGMAQGNLSSLQDNENAGMAPEDAESQQATQAVEEITGGGDLPVIVVAQDDSREATEYVADLQQLGDDFVAQNLEQGPAVSDYITADPIAIPSEDGEAVMLILSLDGEQSSDLIGEEQVTVVLVDQLRADAEPLNDEGIQTWVSGPGGVVADLVNVFAGVDGLLLIVAIVVVLIILIIVYRSPILPFIVLLTAVFALCLAALVLTPLAQNGVVVFSGQTQGILSILVIGAATDYCLLVLARYREELARIESPWAAMQATWKACIPPIAASAATVIAGLLCLLLSSTPSNYTLGPTGTIGIVSAVIATMTLLPALLLIAGERSRAVFWPRKPEYDPDAESHPRSGVWTRLANFVARQPRKVWVVTALILLVPFAFIGTLRTEGASDTEVFLSESEAVDGFDVIDAHFESGAIDQTQIVTAEETYEEVVETVSGLDGVESVSPVTEQSAGGGAAGGPPEGMPGAEGEGGPPAEGQAPPEGEAPAEGAPPAEGEAPTEGQPPAEEAEPLVDDGRVVIDVVTTDSAETQEAWDTVEQIREAIEPIDPDALVGGSAAEYVDTQDAGRADMFTIVPVVLVVIAVMLMILLRAVVAPLIIIAVNILSFGATMGLAAIVFNYILDLPPADPAVVLLGFIFLIALSIDYSIFLMTRVREEAEHHGTKRGTHRGLVVTGGVITSAGVVLAATFSALGVLPLLFMLQIAIVVCLGVLIDTLVVRTLVLSGLSFDIGRPIWWPFTKKIASDDGWTPPGTGPVAGTENDPLPTPEHVRQTADSSN